MSKITLAVTGLVLIAVSCMAAIDEDGAGDAAHFLRNGLGARERGMGGACTVLSDGTFAAFWNPAPSIQTGSMIAGGELEARNSGLFKFSYLGGVLDIGNLGFGTVILTSDIYDMYLLSGGYRIGSVTFGVGAKTYRFGIPGDRGTGIGFDSGMRWMIGLGQTKFELAAVSRDIGWTRIQWITLGDTTINHVSWVNRVAAAITLPVLTGLCSIEADLEFATKRPARLGEENFREKAAEMNLSLGLELSWSGIALRAGIQRYELLADQRSFHPTFGLGITLDAITIDLAIIPSFLGSTYLGGFQISL